MVEEKLLKRIFSLEYLFMKNGIVKNKVQEISKIRNDLENQKFYDFVQKTANLLDTNAVSAIKTEKILISL